MCNCCGYRCCCPTRRYSFGTFFFDMIFTILTGGLWLVYILIRYLRTNSR